MTSQQELDYKLGNAIVDALPEFILEDIIRSGADIDAKRCLQYGPDICPLHLCITELHPGALKLLLSLRAQPNVLSFPQKSIPANYDLSEIFLLIESEARRLRGSARIQDEFLSYDWELLIFKIKKAQK